LGKLQNIGLSNFSLSQIQEINRDLRITAVQAQYSLIDRGIEDKFLTTCKELNINVFTYGPLAQGLLTGKYKEGTKFGDDDCRKRLPHFHGDKFKQKSHIMKKISEISERYDVSMSQVALRWVLENSYVSCAISGIKSISQIEDNVAALEFDIHPDDYNFFYGRSQK
jgi:aryl-alcohol dehydrogenase-like predicted oxidoreductase